MAMDLGGYALEKAVEARLTEARERAAREALVESLRGNRGDWLAAFGLRLIKIGRRLARRHALRQRRTALPALSVPWSHRSRA
jgi:hypothetical protein